MKWFALSLTAAMLGGIASFLIFVLGTLMKKKKPLATNLAYYTVMSSIGFAIILINPGGEIFKNYREDCLRIMTNENNMGLYAFLTASAFITGNVALFTSYYNAPNPGLCDGIAALSGVLVFAYGIVVLGNDIHLPHIIGIALMALSVFLIAS
tara:strand:- start:108 stop:566 length:459 start_codon:yes stop_codon:yes gene_type:complete